MNETVGSHALQELMRYCEQHSKATTLARVAAMDYAGARCLLLNGLPAGVMLGAQAIEKFLKTWLLFSDPAYPVRPLRHSLPRLLEAVIGTYPNQHFPARFAKVMDRFLRHYEARYPDSPGGLSSMTTAEIKDLDDIVIFLNEHIPCPRNVKYRTGMYPMVTFSLGIAKTVPPLEQWIKQHNHALGPLIPRINDEHFEVLAELYPAGGYLDH